jgi:hypothetical protein
LEDVATAHAIDRRLLTLQIAPSAVVLFLKNPD